MTKTIQSTSITIGENCNGITYALQEHVTKHPNSIISDNNISSKEWNATMEKLVELNEKRKSEGKTLIFTGGVDKTKNGYGNSFVVQKGQKIDFTDYEMSALYRAMGVTIKKDPKIKEPELNTAISLEIPENLSTEALKTYTTRIPENANKRVDNRTYNKKGYVVAEFDKQGNNTSVVLRNKDQSIEEIVTKEYDEKKRVVKATSYNEKGNVNNYTENTYNENNKLTRQTIRNSKGDLEKGTELIYNENDVLISTKAITE